MKTSPFLSLSGMALVVAFALSSTVFGQTTNLAAWGLNGDGQTDIPANLGPVSKISAGHSHSLALKTNRTVAAWGNNGSGQCNVPASATNLIAVAGGGIFSAAVKADGTVLVWGATNVPSHPVLSVHPGAKPARTVAAGYEHAIALRSNATVVAWGRAGGIGSTMNSPADPNNVVAIAAGMDHCVLLRSNGTVHAWGPGFGLTSITNTPAGLTNVIAIAAGFYHTLALRSNGTVVAWGNETFTFGCTTVPSDLTNAVAIAAGGYQSMAVTADGRVVQWGMTLLNRDDFTPRICPTDLTNLISISAGFGHSLAMVTDAAPHVTQQPLSRAVPPGWPVTFKITASGNAPLAYQWQCNETNLPNATNVSLTISNASATDLGGYRVIVTNVTGSTTSRLAALTLGTVLAWGDNWAEQNWIPAGITNPTALAIAYDHSVALSTDGNINAWGLISTTIAPGLQSVAGAKSLTSGGVSGLAILSNGTATAWSSYAPATILPANATNMVSADYNGTDNGLAALTDGRVVTWNWFYPSVTNVPVTLTNAVAVSAGRTYALALRSDGTVTKWGEAYSSPNVPAGLGGLVQIGAGLSTTAYGLHNNGQVINLNGGNAINGFSNVVSIAVGNSHLLALRQDGTVLVASNNNYYGQATLPGILSNVVEVAAEEAHSAVRLGNGSPRVTIDPFSQSVAAGSNTTLTAFAAGQPPLSYQWQFNGTNILNATNANHVLSNVALGNIGGYHCIISNALGVVTSAVANVSVNFGPPQFNLLSSPPSFGPTGFSARIESLSGAGQTVVYASTNLVDWLPIHTNPAGPTQFDFLDADATNEPLRFYKAAEQR